jgi:TetR/AcrR family fatty acid metabolism transcriptional regulator
MVAQKRSEIRKGEILKSAERIFAQRGFQEATISDVAREAGVSDATIYEYFSSKEELLFSIPGETAKRGKENLEFQLAHVRGAVDKIRSIIYSYLWFYENHPDYASVAMLILKQNRKFLETNAYRDVQELSRVIIRVIEEGIANGEFQEETNPYLVRSVMLGTIEHMIVRKILHGTPENPLEYVDPLTDLIMQGMGRGDDQGWDLKISITPREAPSLERGARSDSHPEKGTERKKMDKKSGKSKR